MSTIQDPHSESRELLLDQEDSIQLHSIHPSDPSSYPQSLLGHEQSSNQQPAVYPSPQRLAVPDPRTPRSASSSPPSTRSNSPPGQTIPRKPIPTAPQHGNPLRRYYLRGIAGVAIPPLLALYYCLIWVVYLRNSSPSSLIAFGPSGGQWVYYSWFVIGVLGLSASMYGLEGIEASMMMERRWAVDDAMQVMMHADRSWTGPGGWIKVTNSLIRPQKFKSKRLWPSTLWILLSFLTSLIYIALPISGLVMNLGSGFTKSTVNPVVTGFTYENFNARESPSHPAIINWQYAYDARIPSHGVIYTPPDVDRSNANLSNFQQFPNTLPTNDGVSQLFLTAQAGVPVTGKSWGLTLQYNCSIITNLSDFSILRYRNSSKNIFGPNPDRYYNTPTNDTINVYNQTLSSFTQQPLWVNNMEAVIEMGYSMWPKYPFQYESIYDNDEYSTSCYYTARPNKTGKYPGFEQELAFEAILWQGLYPEVGYVDPAPTYNLSIPSTIPELKGVYKSLANVSMPAIGVQCLSSSAVGMADIDGIHSTFSNFQATDTPIMNLTNDCGDRLGPDAIWKSLISLMDTDKEWLSKFFTSVVAPPAYYASYSPDDPGTGASLQLSYFQAEDLRHSLLRLYGAYAVQLMYNGGQGYSTLAGSVADKFINPNITAYQPALVLQMGVVPPILPGLLLILWAALSLVLGCMYGFRRRWSATLDGYSLFAFGVDLADKYKNQLEISATAEFEKVEVLRHIPGLIGDENPGPALGRIGLVHSGMPANKDKKYV